MPLGVCSYESVITVVNDSTAYQRLMSLFEKTVLCHCVHSAADLSTRPPHFYSVPQS